MLGPLNLSSLGLRRVRGLWNYGGLRRQESGPQDLNAPASQRMNASRMSTRVTYSQRHHYPTYGEN
jgi:hypothetical protein